MLQLKSKAVHYGIGFMVTTMLVVVFLFAATATATEATYPNLQKHRQMLKEAVVGAENYHDLSVNAEWVVQSIQRSKTDFEKHIFSATLQKRMQQQLQEHSRPEVLINEFMKQIDYLAATSKGEVNLRSLLHNSLQSRVEAAGGAIAGTITVEGEPPNRPFSVLAFDNYGYFANEAEVEASTGEYRITDLPDGSYYVLTWSHFFMDEIYPDQMASFGSKETWRQAETVAVNAGITTENIDFDLQKGTLISGELYKDDGTPIVDADVSFEITEASSPEVILTKDIRVVGKYYRMRIPGDGAYKLSAQADGFVKEWYQESADWSTATPIIINTSIDSVTDINFTLSADAAGEQLGGISGGVRGPGGLPTGMLVTIGVFNAVDTSFAGLGIGIGGFFGGTYTVENLPPGDYFVYANDYTGSLMGSVTGGGNYVGVFYPDALTIDGAQTVAVEAGQTTTGIDLVLKLGGNIAGRVTNAEGAPLDSLLIFAFQVERSYGENDPAITQLQYAAAETDLDGNYTIIGLPEGLYAVRTMSWLTLKDMEPAPGKHAGQVIDEYYGDVQDIFDLENAELVPVIVPQTTENIDIQLDPAGYITGRVTCMPLLAFSDIDSLGDYVLGPLPSGSYKALAVSGFQNRHKHLTEFWNGVRTFAEASVIEINAPRIAENINFTLDRGAIIQGFVDLDSGGSYRAGADTLDGVPVIVYDAETGKVASYDFVQFSGGYRVDRLLAGSYKVLVMPAMAPFASTYFGGGATLEDPASSTVTVDFGDVVDADVQLDQATGSISGKVVDKDTQQPVFMAMVIAYGSSGHPAGVAISGVDFATGNITSFDGSYKIEGLRDDSYFVRTFALSSLLPMVQGLTQFADADFMDILSDPGDLFGLSLQAYADKWYDDVTDVLLINVDDLLINMTSFGIPAEHDQSLFPVYLPLPYFVSIPYSATPVQVVAGGETSGIDFALEIGALEDIVTTPVESQVDGQSLPKQFSLSPSYPNPFNPATKLEFSLPRTSQVDLAVYDLLGRRVRTLVKGELQAGDHSSSWDGKDGRGAVLPSGIYIIRLEANNHAQVTKVTFIK